MCFGTNPGSTAASSGNGMWITHLREGLDNSDYTPQNKPVEEMIKEVYGGG